MEKLKRTKIGTEYYRAGYGRTKPKKATVWLINGYAYARDKKEGLTAFTPLGGELAGYVKVNAMKSGEGVMFYETSGISEPHRPYEAEPIIQFEKPNK